MEQITNTHAIVFDIETGGLPPDLIEIPEFSAPSNYKSEESITKYKLKKSEEYIEKAALSAITGEVLAIGYSVNGVDINLIHSKSEKDIIKEFWDILEMNPRSAVIGWNSNTFDMPFMIRRSWLHGITPPIFNARRPDAGNHNFIDLMQLWGCGTYETAKLDAVAKFFGVGAKNGDGAFFKDMYLADKQQALDYLRNDVDMTIKVAQKMGVVQ